MGSLFGGRTPTAPAPDPKVTEAQEKQEQRLDAQEQQKMRQLESRRRARRIGGQRMLLSQERETPQTGVQNKLGRQ